MAKWLQDMHLQKESRGHKEEQDEPVPYDPEELSRLEIGAGDWRMLPIPSVEEVEEAMNRPHKAAKSSDGDSVHSSAAAADTKSVLDDQSLSLSLSPAASDCRW